MRNQLFLIYLLIFSDCFDSNLFAYKLNDKLIDFEDIKLFPFSSENISLLLKSLAAVYKSVEFFDSVVNDIDIDGLLGVRILDDQLFVIQRIIDKYETRKVWTQLLANTVRDLKEQTESLLKNGLTSVQYSDRKYFKEVGGILENGLWAHIPNRNLSVNVSEKFKYVLELEDIPLNESVSDSCVSLLLNKCLVSDQCLDVMTEFGYQDYPLSHQVFYWQMAKMKCDQQISVEDFNHLTTTFCSNMFWENKVIELNSFPDQYLDLFMENIAFCGIIGFKQFTEDRSWLKKVVGDQKRFGCYGQASEVSVSKRSDKILRNDCSSHKTSMALASTVVFIRDMISELIDYTFDVRYKMH